MPEQGQYPDQVGYYEGSAYEQPPRTGVGGVLGFHAARWMENRAETDIYREMSNLQGQMDESYRLMQVSQSPEEQQYHQENIILIRGRYQELVNYAQTGASGIRASAAVIDTPGLLSAWQGVKEGYPGGFNVTIPLQLTEPAQGAVPDLTYESPTQPAVGTYKQPAAAQAGLNIVSPLATQAPEFGAYGAPSGQGVDIEPVQPFQPTAAGTTIPDTGVGGLVEGAYAGDVVGGALPAENYPMAAYQARHGTSPGGGTEVSPFTGPTEGGGTLGVPTPGGRGFATYDQLRLAMEAAGRPRDEYGRVGTGVFQPWEMQGMYEGKYSAADSLQQFLGGRGQMYRGLMTQRVDLGQGLQDYQVRRDAYGNIRSFTPGGRRNQPWNQNTSRYD
jgi:hypothetical protein